MMAAAIPFIQMAAQKAQQQQADVAGMAPDIASIFGGQAQSKYTQQGLQDLINRYKQGMSSQQKMLGQSTGYLQPYNTTGQGAIGQEYSMLQQGQDPTAMVNHIMSTFQQSPAQHASIQAGLGAVSNQLESQGLSQSGLQQKALESYAQNQTADQQQQYLNNILGARQQTIGDLGQLGGFGLGAAGQEGQFTQQSADSLSNLLASQGQAELSQQQAKGQAKSSMWGGIGDIASRILSF